VAALDYAEAVMRTVKLNRWGLDNAQKPERLAADNLFSGQLDRKGIALWAVSWQQGVSLRYTNVAELADFTLYTATHEVGDGPVAEDRVELPQE
jgi:glutamine cyclotransferase